jgi:hypothetical protein
LARYVILQVQFQSILLALPFRVETLWCTHQKQVKVWYPYILGSCGVCYRSISDITEGSTWTLWCTQKQVKVWYAYIVGSCGVHYRNISGISEGSTLASSCLTTMCFQFVTLNIYHSYGCHLKGRVIVWPAAFKSANAGCWLSQTLIQISPQKVEAHTWYCFMSIPILYFWLWRFQVWLEEIPCTCSFLTPFATYLGHPNT